MQDYYENEEREKSRNPQNSETIFVGIHSTLFQKPFDTYIHIYIYIYVYIYIYTYMYHEKTNIKTLLLNTAI